MDPNTIVAQKFEINDTLGSGSFGQVFLGTKIGTQKKVAIKIEKKSAKNQQLLSEAKVIKDLKGAGIPKVYWHGIQGEYNCMVMQLLGDTLEKLLTKYDRKVPLKDLSLIAKQLIDRIEHIHEHNYIHRDIKPENFVMGLGKEHQKVYAIDFGLAKKYRDPVTKMHIRFSENHSLVGTARYSSINTHMGIQQSRRDDVESIIYLILYLMEGRLPWQGVRGKHDHERFYKMMNMKMKFTSQARFDGIPQEFINIIHYVQKIRFEEPPDYNYIRRELEAIALKDRVHLQRSFNLKKIGKLGPSKSSQNVKPLRKNSLSVRFGSVSEIEEPSISEAITIKAKFTYPKFQDREMIFKNLRDNEEQFRSKSPCIIF